jgi:hypothetical protein
LPSGREEDELAPGLLKYYPHGESTSPRSRQILAGVPDDEQANIAAGNTARVYNFDVARLTAPA